MRRKMFLKLDGVRGESENPRHFGEIEIYSFTWGGKHQLTDGAGGGAGKASINDLTIFKQSDITTPILQVACWTGQYFSQVALTIEDISTWGSVARSIVFNLKSVLIDSCNVKDDVDEIALNFKSYKMTST